MGADLTCRPRGVRARRLASAVTAAVLTAAALPNSLANVRPAAAASSCTIVKVAAGDTSAAAILSDGTVVTWGALAQSNTPVPVQGLSNVTQLVGGGGDFYAIESDGTLWAWGGDGSGQLGDGRYGVSGALNTATQVPGLSGIRQVAAGSNYALALTAQGAVWAWGDDYNGQLGDGNGAHQQNVTVFSASPTRVRDPAGTGYLQNVIWIGSNSVDTHSLAVTDDGSVWAWGSNWSGQLGDGTSQNERYLPGRVTPPSGGWPSPIFAVTATQASSSGLAADGSVWSWGSGFHGTFGNGANVDSVSPVKGLATAIQTVTGGGGQILATDSSGALWAWGWNVTGELGIGTTQDAYSPVQVKGPGGNGVLTGVTSSAAGRHFSLAVNAAGAWAWGDNTSGQLGNGSTTGSLVPIVVGCSSTGTPLLNLSASGPSALAVSGWTYSPNPFTITATAQNAGTGTAHGVQLSVNIPIATALSVVTSPLVVDVGDLVPGASVSQSWQIQAAPRDANTTWSYSVSATSAETPKVLYFLNLQLPKMKSALIFIPGLAGSELGAVRDSKSGLTITNSGGGTQSESYKKGDSVWINVAKVLLDPEYFGLLRFGADGKPLYGDFYPDGNMIETNKMFYYGVKDYLKKNGQYVEGNNFFVFTYDWRYDAQTNVAALDSLVSNILATGAPSIDIVSHSMGTQVTRAWLLKGEHRARVNHVVLLAPPNLGTPKGTYTSLAGTCLGPLCRLSPPLVKYIFNTLPGAFDQAVSTNYWLYYDGSDKAHPLPFIDRQVVPNQSSYADLRAREIAGGAIPSAVSAGEAFHNSDLTWPSSIGGKISIVAGTGQCTLGQITADPRVPRRMGTIPPRYNYGEVNGDGTVTLGSASMGGSTLGGTNYRVYYRKGNHDDIGGHNTAILDDALRLLQDQTVDPGTPGTAPSCAAVSVRSPMELQVTDAAGNHLGGLTPDSYQLDIAGGGFDRFNDMKIATLGNPGMYRVDLAGTGNGDAIVEVRLYEDPNGLMTNNIFRVPATSSSKGTFTYDRGSGRVSAMTLDLNGDGKTILTIQPTVLTGAAGADTTPPALTIDTPAAGQAVVGSFLAKWTATDTESGMSLNLAGLDLATDARLLTGPAVVELAPGQHSMDALAMDKAQNYSLAHVDFTADSFAWQNPTSGAAGSTIPVKFAVTTPAGSFVSDASVRVDLVNSAGIAVAGPLTLGQGVTIAGGAYQANVGTTGLPSGNYTLRVRFDSAALVGQSTVPIQVN